jgi:hypothetical protein
MRSGWDGKPDCMGRRNSSLLDDFIGRQGPGVIDDIHTSGVCTFGNVLRAVHLRIKTGLANDKNLYTSPFAGDLLQHRANFRNARLVEGQHVGNDGFRSLGSTRTRGFGRICPEAYNRQAPAKPAGVPGSDTTSWDASLRRPPREVRMLPTSSSGGRQSITAIRMPPLAQPRWRA